MSAERLAKESLVADLRDRLAKVQGLVLVDFRGLTVEADTNLRNEFRSSGCHYKVVKNTLLGLAVKGTPLEGIEKLLAGPTAVAFSVEDALAAAKVAAKVAATEKQFVIKGGAIEGKALDAAGVEAVSKLPGRDEMRAMFLATLNAVPQGFVALLAAAPQSFVFLLKAREGKLSEGG